MKKNLKLIFLVLVFISVHITIVSAITNPAAVYCNEMGYNYEIEKTGNGEIGKCVVNNNKFDSWDFIEGKVGKEYSYCSKQGYNVEVATDGRNPYSREYAVCVSKDNSLNQVRISMTELMGLEEKLNHNGGSEQDTEINVSQELTEESSLEPLTRNPPEFSWRNIGGYNWLTPVKDQGGCGSCWAFAAVGVVESKIKISRMDPYFDVDLAEQELVSCSKKNGCSGGWSDQALKYIKEKGISDEPCFFYRSSNSYCSNLCPTKSRRSWYMDNYGYMQDNDEEVKKYLREKGPLATYLFMGGYFDEKRVYRCYNNNSLHAITLVGYNDIDDYWIAKNSWGKNWNEDGYFKIGYKECMINDYANDPIYVDIAMDKIEKINVNNVEAKIGDVVGSYDAFNKKDENYMIYSEDCSGNSCGGLDIWTSFPTSQLFNIKSLDVISYHKVEGDVRFTINFWDYNNWKNIDSIASSSWYLTKYNICNSVYECDHLLTAGKVLLQHFHDSCEYCVKNNIDIDWLYLEAKLSKEHRTNVGEPIIIEENL